MVISFLLDWVVSRLLVKLRSLNSFFTGTVVLLVGDLLHPVDDLAVELFLDGDVGHRGTRRGAMPMLLAGRARNDVARTDDLDRPAPALHVAAAGGDDERLAERMRV